MPFRASSNTAQESPGVSRVTLAGGWPSRRVCGGETRGSSEVTRGTICFVRTMPAGGSSICGCPNEGARHAGV